MGIVNRWYDILELLIARDKLTDEELEDRLHLTTYTIKNNIQLLNNELVGIAQIEKEKNKYYLNIYDFEKLEQIMSGKFKKDSDFNSSSKRIAYILSVLILNSEYHVMTDLAEDLSVSRNTVNNDLKTARTLIEKYDVTIESLTSKGIRLVGDELDKRMIYVNLVQDYFNYRFITEEVINQVLEILNKYQINKETTNRVIKAIDVLKGAIESGTFLTQAIPYYTNAAKNSNVVNEIISFFEEYYNITLSQYEIDFLSSPFNLTNLNQNNSLIQEKVKYLPEVFDFMMERINESFVIDLNEETLYSEMSNHLFYLINRSIFYTAPKEMFFGEVEEKYPFPFEIAKVAASSIGKKINRQIHSIEIDYLTLYFEMALRGSALQRDLNVAIISNTGRGTARLIRRQIDSVVGEGTKFTQFTEEDYSNADLTDYFVIFTTVPLKNPPKGVPIIRISNILSEQWLSNELEKVITTNPNLIKETLNDIYPLDVEKNYHENIIGMMDKLHNDGLIDREFKSRIIRREEKQKTIYGNGIAFPHEVNPDSHHIILALGVFMEEYEANNEEVKIVFLLAVPENLTMNNEAKLLELYDLIFRLANDINFKKDLSSITSRIEVIEYLEDRRLSL